jgi:hypothetical protein
LLLGVLLVGFSILPLLMSSLEWLIMRAEAYRKP